MIYFCILVVNDYIMTCKESSQIPSLKQFIDNNITQIIKTTDFRRNISECWTKLFIDELEELNVEGEVEKVCTGRFSLFCISFVFILSHIFIIFWLCSR